MNYITIEASNLFLAAINSLNCADATGSTAVQTKAELLEAVDAAYGKDKQYKAKLTQLKREIDAIKADRHANRVVIDGLRQAVDTSYPTEDDTKKMVTVFCGRSQTQVPAFTLPDPVDGFNQPSSTTALAATIKEGGALNDISTIIRVAGLEMGTHHVPYHQMVANRLVDYFVWNSTPVSNALVGDLEKGNIRFIALLIRVLHDNIDTRYRRFLFDIAYTVYYHVTRSVNNLPSSPGFMKKFIPHINQLYNVEDHAIADVSHSVFVGAFISGDYDKANA